MFFFKHTHVHICIYMFQKFITGTTFILIILIIIIFHRVGHRVSRKRGFPCATVAIITIIIIIIMMIMIIIYDCYDYYDYCFLLLLILISLLYYYM